MHIFIAYFLNSYKIREEGWVCWNGKFHKAGYRGRATSVGEGVDVLHLKHIIHQIRH